MKNKKTLTPFLMTAVSTPRITYYNSLRSSRKVWFIKNYIK